MSDLKPCLRDPIPEIFDAARDLDAAVSAPLRGDPGVAADLIRRADLPAVRDWANALWGKGGPWSRPLLVDASLPPIPKAERPVVRMPSSAEKRALIARIRAEIRTLMRAAYPDALAP